MKIEKYLVVGAYGFITLLLVLLTGIIMANVIADFFPTQQPNAMSEFYIMIVSGAMALGVAHLTRLAYCKYFPKNSTR